MLSLSRTRVSAFVVRLLLAVFCWWLISEGRTDSWLIGLPASLLAVLLSFYLQPPANYRLSFSGLLAFWWFFSRQSLVAGFDVAKRILAPEMPIQPGEVRVPVHLPEGAPRWLLAMTLSLLPGSLSLRFDGDELILHCLDITDPLEVEVLRTEKRIAAVFGLSGVELITKEQSQ